MNVPPLALAPAVTAPLHTGEDAADPVGPAAAVSFEGGGFAGAVGPPTAAVPFEGGGVSAAVDPAAALLEEGETVWAGPALASDSSAAGPDRFLPLPPAASIGAEERATAQASVSGPSEPIVSTAARVQNGSAPGDIPTDLADKLRLAEAMDDLLALPRSQVLRFSPAALRAGANAVLPPQLHDRTGPWVAALRNQAQRAYQVERRLAADGPGGHVQVIEDLLSQAARREWLPQFSLSRWLHRTLPESMRLSLGFKLDEPALAALQVGSPRHPHHLVVTLGRKDYLRFTHGYATRWDSIPRRTRKQWAATWSGGGNLSCWRGQLSLLTPLAPGRRAIACCHEESHARDGLFSDEPEIPQPRRGATALARAAGHRYTQRSLLKTEIIAYLTDSGANSTLAVLHRLMEPTQYSGHLRYAIRCWSAALGDHRFFPTRWLREHYNTLTRSLQAAEVVLQCPGGDNLLRLTALDEWPRLAGQLVAAGLHPAVAGQFPTGLAVARAHQGQIEELALLQHIHAVIARMNRQGQLLRHDTPADALPEDARLSPADWAIAHWVQGRALAGEQLYLDEAALLQALQYLRAAWIGLRRGAVPDTGLDIEHYVGPQHQHRRLARVMAAAYQVFFPE